MKVDGRLEVGLVTGASRGIGRAIAVALGSADCYVIVNYRVGHEAAQETLRLIEAAGGSGELACFDVSDAEEVGAVIAGLIAKHGSIDILVNNAGIRRDMLMLWMQPQDWRDVINTNLNSFFYVTQPIVKQMMLKRRGRIINISSASGQVGSPGQVHYSAAKAGLIGATKALAKEVAPRGITVNAIAPGYIDTDMVAEQNHADLAKKIPLGWVGAGEDIANTVLFLSGPGGRYVTGQVLGVNGGLVL